MAVKNKYGEKISYDSEVLIDRLQKHIAELGGDSFVDAFYKNSDGAILYTDYAYPALSGVFPEKFKDKNVKMMSMSALMVHFEIQNSIL